MIIFDEEKRVEEMLENGVNSKTALLDFILLGKYLIDRGYENEELEHKLIKILSDKQELIPVSYLPTIIPKIIKVAKKTALQHKKEIEITKAELDILENFSEKAKRIGFVYLVCYKFFEKEFSIKPIEVKTFAKMTSLRNPQLYSLEKELFDFGFLKYKETRTDIFYVVNLPKEESETIITIKDYRDFIYYYEKYLGENIVECKECGRLIKKNSNVQKYCKDCKKKKNREKVEKCREKNKENKNV